MSADNGMRLRPVSSADLTALQELLEADPEYARRVTGADPGPDEARELLSARPPDLPVDRKVVLGAFDRKGLAAVIDLLRGWPDPETGHIGLLQVHTARKREGIGGRAHALLLAWLDNWPEITTLRAAIVAINADQADPFWSAMGYVPQATKPYQAGSTTTEVTVWTRPVSDPGP